MKNPDENWKVIVLQNEFKLKDIAEKKQHYKRWLKLKQNLGNIQTNFLTIRKLSYTEVLNTQLLRM